MYPYPKFKEIFNYNIQTGTQYVSPFHKWDFMLETKIGNIFIDIDGSIHDEDQTDYVVTNYVKDKVLMSEIENFYDSKRPYQTDNLPAYILQCFNDEISLDDKIINVCDKHDITTLREFLKRIK